MLDHYEQFILGLQYNAQRFFNQKIYYDEIFAPMVRPSLRHFLDSRF